MSAIQTNYNGFKFRSRTEARWAVFFDNLEIKYDYEKEGYALDSGAYLPDFWLPEYNLWVEIKGEDATEIERKLCDELARHTKKMALLVSGQPDPEKYNIHIFSGNGDLPFDGTDYIFGQDRKVDKVLWIIDKNGESGFCLDPTGNERSGDKYLTGQWANWINTALDAAKSARFEHGEKPR